MLVPVCCFSCNRRTGSQWIEYCQRVDRGEDPGAVLDALGASRLCCRRMLMCSVELNSLFAAHEAAADELTQTEVRRTSALGRTVSCD